TRETRVSVAAGNWDATCEVAARDRVRRMHEPLHGADDRTSLEPGDETEEHERREQRGEQAVLGPRSRRVDPRLWREHGERPAGCSLERWRDDCAVAPAVETHGRGATGREPQGAFGDEGDPVAALETRAVSEPS